MKKGFRRCIRFQASIRCIGGTASLCKQQAAMFETPLTSSPIIISRSKPAAKCMPPAEPASRARRLPALNAPFCIIQQGAPIRVDCLVHIGRFIDLAACTAEKLLSTHPLGGSRYWSMRQSICGGPEASQCINLARIQHEIFSGHKHPKVQPLAAAETERSNSSRYKTKATITKKMPPIASSSRAQAQTGMQKAFAVQKLRCSGGGTGRAREVPWRV
jgi:hypothetical protein